MERDAKVGETEAMFELRDHGWNVVKEWANINIPDSEFKFMKPTVREYSSEYEKYTLIGKARVTRTICGRRRKFDIGFAVSFGDLAFIIELIEAPGEKYKFFYETICEINNTLSIGKIIYDENGSVIFIASQLFSKSLDVDLLGSIVAKSFLNVIANIRRIDLLLIKFLERRVSELGGKVLGSNISLEPTFEKQQDHPGTGENEIYNSVEKDD